MFDIPDTKTFMDSVHGYITVPKCFVSNIIDTDIFQRLRNIDQTGMRILYHTAKHDRFSHSLGVFHLGCKAVDALLENFKRDEYWNISSDSNCLLFWAKNKVLFLIACLLHDIGHTPFSHSLEDIVINNVDDGEGASLHTHQLVETINSLENDYSEIISEKDIKASSHEKLGSLYILENFSKNIEMIFDELIAIKYPMISSTDILYSEHYLYNPIIDKKDLSHDICFIARMILGLNYKGFEPEKQIKNCFISLLNGKNFDVDKLDYIIRDTKMSGISNICIDVERLLGSVSIITTTKYICSINQTVNNHVISNIKGNEESNFHLSGELCGTFLFENGCNVTIKKGSTFVSLSAINNRKIKYTVNQDNINHAVFNNKTIIVQNGEIIKTTTGKNCDKILPDKNLQSFECMIENAEIVSDAGFSFTVDENTSADLAVELKINGKCDITVNGKFKIESPMSCFGHTKLNGKIQETVLIGNLIKEKAPCKQVYNEFIVGFNKQAINIISNVLEARNYLYLWIYAHHKVVYYANFLIPVLVKNIFKDAQDDQFPSWKLNYKNIAFIDDAYVWTGIKFFYHYKRTNDEIKKLCNELFNRRYKISLYKSLAEYDLVFQVFSDKEKIAAKQFFFDHCDTEKYPYISGSQMKAGFFNDSLLEIIKKDKNLKNITRIVIVDASYSVKLTDVNNVFIKFNNNVAAISEIPLLSNQISKIGDTNQYFYIYFETDELDCEKVNSESRHLKQVLVEIIKNEVIKNKQINDV